MTNIIKNAASAFANSESGHVHPLLKSQEIISLSATPAFAGLAREQNADAP